MKSNSFKKHLFGYALFLVIIFVFSSVTHAQKNDKQLKVKSFCSENWSNGDKVSFSEIREMTVRPTGSLSVDSGRNGGITVTGENRSDVSVRACVRAWGDTDEAAKSIAGKIQISNGSDIRTEGVSDNSNWSVSYEILVPRQTNLKLNTFNGGIIIKGVDGDIDFKATNGGVILGDLAGDVKGRTTNGGVIVTLTGASWKGAGLDVETTNGGVKLAMSENYSARIETGTVNGGFKSDISQLNIDRTDRNRSARITTDLNGGGALIRVVTTNGGIKISTSADNL
jgi:DUF4097 and DUF4098 domain-containing protein YvlB